MTAALMDAALRSLAIAVTVGALLRLFRVRDVFALKRAWTLVLAAAFLMPLLLPISARWPRATLVLPAIARKAVPNDIVTHSKPATLAVQPPVETARIPSPDPQPIAPQASLYSSQTVAPVEDNFVGSTTSPETSPGMSPGMSLDRFSLFPVPAAPAPAIPMPGATHPLHSLLVTATLFYFFVAAVLLFRLFSGIFSAFRLWRAAEPVSAAVMALGEGLRLRSSAAVSSPVTLGSAVVLPIDYAEWADEKLRIVFAHERAHIRQGDFYLQALAGLYAAVVWISPLGWWLKRKLADLAEAIGDRSGLEKAGSRFSYAQVLLEIAAAPRPTLIGVAMARSSNLSHRIERLFDDRAFRQAFAASRRTLLTAVLVPMALFAATTLVRVEAATQTPQQPAPASGQTPVTGQSRPVFAPPAAVPKGAGVGVGIGAGAGLGVGAGVGAQTPPQTEPPAGSAPGAAPAPAAGAVPASPAHIHIDVPAIHVNVPAQHIEVPAIHVDVPQKHIEIPAIHVDVPAVHVDVPAQRIDVPPVHVDVPAVHIEESPAGAQNRSGDPAPFGSAYSSTYRSGGELYAMLTGFGHALIQPAAPSSTEATFDRTLTLSGKLDLRVMNASGHIHLTRGPANQVRVHARVYSEHASDAAEVQSIAANPPIEQEGNSIRIGHRNQQGPNHIGIDYDIEAPADAALDAMSGSGNISDEGVGEGAKLQTGSGNIVATGLEGGFKTETGSGNISVENTGDGDAKAETGSGNIEVNSVHGALTAETGSGTIKAAGAPASPWKLQTGSGTIDFSPGNAPLTLDASCGSGMISSGQPMTAQTSSDRHRLHADLNGGGPVVRIETGSGNIRIH